MTVRILVGDCRVRLREFPNNFFQTVVTSWPYWGLRDYGVEPTVWGGDPECEHVWGAPCLGDTRPYGAGLGKWQHGEERVEKGRKHIKVSQGQFCQLCGAWLGNFGLEPTPELYVQHGVEISREVWRALRDDGSMWVNLGDTHWGGKGQSAYAWLTEHQDRPTLQKAQHQITGRGQTRPQDYQHPTIKPKDLVGIPWACAFALRDDGWWWRQAIPWIKDNPMPGSQDDRPTTSHEYLFLFSKSKRYYYDKVAIFEPCASGPSDIKKMIEGRARIGGKNKASQDPLLKASSQTNIGRKRGVGDPSGRNRRTADWWYDSLDLLIEQQYDYLAHLEHIKAKGGMLLTPDGEPLALKVNPEGFKGDHYATFPTRLVEPCVKASTSERGACPDCGAPWERVVNRKFVPQADTGRNVRGLLGQKPMCDDGSNSWDGYPRGTTNTTTIGFRPTCTCYDDRYRTEFPKARSARKRWQQDMADRWWPRVRQRPGKDDWPTVPCVVLDPMGGAGTTAMVADRLGRDAVSIDIKLEYGQMSRDRIVQDAGPLFNPQVTLEV